MKAKRFRIALAVLLVVALSPIASALAFGAGNSGENRSANATSTGANTQAEGAGSPAALAAGSGVAIADGNTASTWRDWGLENSTENVGRIWTDKTVQAGDITLTGAGGTKTIEKGDSTFLTALSAISSTSNLKSTATTPLDIVLVLDASGSMSDPMGRTDSTKRINALKTAANSFVDEIAKQNEGIADASKRHQVAIVKFAGDESNRVGNDKYRDGQNTYNYSQVMKAMAACTNTSKDQFKSTVNSIEPAGATRADNGLKLAKEQTSQREDAKKVVIFFTDGTPTSFSEFDPRVASDAVTAAKSMKDASASVYTIGIFDDANPSADVSSNQTSVENKFMQAASSNYPDATYTNGWRGYTWNFGTRAQNSDFYKSATNADELKKVFDDISQEITKGAGYPTDTREGYEDESGFITFTDQLGDYMQIDGFTTIVFANQVFDNPVKTTKGLVDTYTFTGEAGNVLYPSGNLNSIDITVTHSEDLQTGDLVEVKIPGALIPLRHFEVNEDGTGSVSLTFPIRVFYGSSLKAGAAEELANPGSELAAYITGNSSDGTVSFLANKWSGGADGDVVANFTPSKGNSYYYITEDTPIFQDEACTQRANAPLEQGKTYYYQRTWYDIDGGKATQKTKTVSFDSGVVENIGGYISSDNGKAYFKAGTPRMTYINELNTTKGKDTSGASANNTQTASTFINPKWAGEQVNTFLGNNGKLSVELPGALAVTKQLQVPAGYSASDFADEAFEFTVSVPAAANSTLKAEVKNAEGETVAAAFDMAFDANGQATQSLKPGETLYVHGLAAGSAYKVSEAQRDGFTQVEAAGLEGTVSAGETFEAKVVNAYAATGTLNGETALAGEKILTGRDWQASDKFTFLLKDANTSVEAPMPEGAVGGVARIELVQPEGTSDGTPVGFSFGNITYTQPGTYVYEIHESAADSMVLPGVSASGALYQVAVTVADKEHNGVLTIESSMKQLKNDAGVQVDQAVQMATFTNAYNTETEMWAPIGQKTYTDSTGANSLKADMFHVAVCSDDAEAPLPEGAGAMPELGGSQWRGVVTSVEASGGVTFPQATYGFIDLQGETEKTYTYKLMEVVKNPSGKWVAVKDALAASDYQHNGMQYDPSVWTAYVTIKSVDDTLELNVTFEKDGVEQQGALFSFSNAYNPAPATAVVEGSKTLTGRDMADGESFGFSLSAADKATQDAIAAGTVMLPNVATVADAKNGEAKGFAFGSIAFAKPGTYAFNVRESQWNGAALPEDGANGMTFDRGVKTVTVIVTDDHGGSLKAKVAYPESGMAFANRYSSSTTFAGIEVSKTLNGRAMKAGEFGFAIEGADEASAALLADADKSFTNENNRADGVADVMTKLAGRTFTTEDNGKTYEFAVREVVPEGAVLDAETGLWHVAETGVYYDGTRHAVKLAVADNGKGKLDATVTVDGQSTNMVYFVNKYRASKVTFDTAQAQLKKVLEGRDWIDSDSFEFTLKALTEGAPMPKDASGNVVTATTVTRANAEGFGFGTITFTADMLGASQRSKTFEYEVAETCGSIPGIDYASNKAVIKVTVTDDGTGKLKASAAIEDGVFVNRYEASLSYSAAGGLSVAKTLTGRDMAEGQFVISVTPADEASAQALGLPLAGKEVAMPAAADGVQVAKSVVDGAVTFTQKDAGKTYTYTVAELGESGNGYTYDKAVRTVAITVVDNPAAAALTATTVVTGGPEGTQEFTYTDAGAAGGKRAVVPFANSYAASTDVPGGAAASVNATKALTGRPLGAGEFAFAVEYAIGGGDVLQAVNAADGTVTFGELRYDTNMLADLVASGKAVKSDAGGKPAWSVQYLAYEKADGLSMIGITAKTQSIPFTVTVVDNGDGTLTATANTGAGLTFENEYSTSGPVEVDLTGVKMLAAQPGLQPADITGKFTFAVSSEDPAAPMPERTSATNAADGSVDFGSITFTLDDLNCALGDTQKQAGKIDKEIAPVSAGEKDSGEEDTAVSAGEAAGDIAEAADVDSAAGQGAGAVAATLGDIAAGQQDADVSTQTANEPAAQAAAPVLNPAEPRSHTFTYKVTETGSAPGVINDAAATKTVSFKVTDDGSGKLAVERVGDAKDPAFAFTNTYSVEPVASSVTDQLGVNKTLTGRDMVAGEFSFELLEGDQVVATGVNDANGNVALSAITYTEPGTHQYTLREVGGGTKARGVTYDGATFAVTATVADNGNGTLGVTHRFDNGLSVAFANAYSPADAYVTVGASKTLLGKDLADGQFTFLLTAHDGTVVQAKNAADGTVTFPKLRFTQPGTYEYTLSELNDAQANVTYDKRTYRVTITVADDLQGHLVAAMASGDEALTFTNEYVAPPVPEQPADPAAPSVQPGQSPQPAAKALTQTGDSKLLLLVPLAAVAMAGVAAMVALCVIHRREHHR